MEYKKFMTGLARKAGDIMRSNFVLGMKTEWKSDNTPLTATDKEINNLVIESVRRNFPDHSVLAEEGSAETDSEFVWVCDPIDGTIPYSHGYPIFTFSLALTKNGESIAGVLYDPMCDRLFYAEKGEGTTLNGKKIKVSKQQNMQNAILDAGSVVGMDKVLKKYGAKSAKLYAITYSGLLVACGEFVGLVFTMNTPWDAAAVKIIVEEAGGKVTDIEGKEQRYDKPINGYIASNGILHQHIIDVYQETISQV